MLFGWDAFSYEKVNSVNHIGLAGMLQASVHPEIIFELKPDLGTYHKLVRFKTNSQGLRDQEYTLEKPPSTIRFAVIGDSFSMPTGVAIEDAYHSRVEERFNARDDGARYEFINFSIGGYNLRQYLGILEHKAQRYNPDVILIGFCGHNDHRAPGQKRFKFPYVPRPETSPFFSSFADMTMRRFRPFNHGLRLKAIDEAGLEYVTEHFSKLARISRESGMKVVIVYLGFRPLSDLQEGAAIIEELAVQQGLGFVDIGHTATPEGWRRNIILPIDGHPNANIHAIYADRLAEYLGKTELGP